MNNLPKVSQLHFSIYDFPKQALVVMGAYRYKICPISCVIILFQTDRASVVFFGGKHDCFLSWGGVCDMPLQTWTYGDMPPTKDWESCISTFQNGCFVDTGVR